ncbi:hypothetical protein M9458_003086, partial [Cirrhinus mrigala]
TVVLHPGLHLPSPIVLIALTPVANQTLYISPGIPPVTHRVLWFCIVVLRVSLVPMLLVFSFLAWPSRFTDYLFAFFPLDYVRGSSAHACCTDYSHILPLLHLFAIVPTLPVFTMSLSRPNKSLHLDPLASYLPLHVTGSQV